MNQGTMQQCLTCGGLIPEPNVNYGYSGKICYCPEPPGRYRRRASDVSIQVTQASPEDARSRQVVAGSAQAEGGEQPEQGGQPIKTRHCLTTGPAPDVASKACNTFSRDNIFRSRCAYCQELESEHSRAPAETTQTDSVSPSQYMIVKERLRQAEARIAELEAAKAPADNNKAADLLWELLEKRHDDNFNKDWYCDCIREFLEEGCVSRPDYKAVYDVNAENARLRGCLKDLLLADTQPERFDLLAARKLAREILDGGK